MVEPVAQAPDGLRDQHRRSEYVGEGQKPDPGTTTPYERSDGTSDEPAVNGDAAFPDREDMQDVCTGVEVVAAVGDDVVQP
jgi:hypothetical protein